MIARQVVQLLLASLLAGCAAKMPVADLAPPSIVLETVPASARVSVEGEETTSPAVVPIRIEEGRLTVSVVRDGYHPRTVELDAAEMREMAGQRVVIVLSPDLFDPAARPIESDDVGQLGQAGVALVKADRCADAMQFFRHALLVDPRLPVAHKGMGACYAKMKRNREAIEAYKLYLLNAPNAPDAKRVQEIVSRAEGDISIPEQ